MTSQSNEDAATRKPSVLIVDDEPQIIEFLRVCFGYEGFVVTVATSGPDALRSIAEQPPDIVLLDIMLPGLDGMEVAHRIREVHDMAIIMLTANDTLQDRIDGLNVGADDYITKPFIFKELMARVRAVMRRRGAH